MECRLPGVMSSGNEGHERDILRCVSVDACVDRTKEGHIRLKGGLMDE